MEWPTITFLCGLIGLLLTVILCWLHSRCIRERERNLEKNLPDPLVIILPQFAGSILSPEEVTFREPPVVTKTDFSIISSWGENAILSFKVCYGEILQLIAWRPESRTNGAAQTVEKRISQPAGWNGKYKIGEVKLTDGEVVVYPRVMRVPLSVGMSISEPMILILGLISTIVMMISATKMFE